MNAINASSRLGEVGVAGPGTAVVKESEPAPKEEDDDAAAELAARWGFAVLFLTSPKLGVGPASRAPGVAGVRAPVAEEFDVDRSSLGPDFFEVGVVDVGTFAASS